MMKANGSLKDPLFAIETIEKQMDGLLASRRDEIDKALAETITREKEEARKKITAAEQEFENVRHVIEEHKSAVAELSASGEQIRNRLKDSIGRALESRRMIEKISVRVVEELADIDGLNRKLEEIRKQTRDKSAFLKIYLEEHFGIQASVQVTPIVDEIPADWTSEMLKMKKIVEILGPVTAAQAQAQEAVADKEPEEDAGSAASANAPAKETCPMETEAECPAPAVETAAAEETPKPDAGTLLNLLTSYQKTEPVINGSELAYFQKDRSMVLDIESLLETMTKVFENARELHAQIKQTGSIRDLFLIKQEILNQQEVLRRIFYRIVKFCDKEGGSLPLYVSEIITVPVLKDILERLTLGNWSNAGDFISFTTEAVALKNAIVDRLSPRGDYLQSLYDQVEGRLDPLN